MRKDDQSKEHFVAVCVRGQRMTENSTVGILAVNERKTLPAGTTWSRACKEVNNNDSCNLWSILSLS